MTKRQRKAVVMLYEGAYTNKEIAETLHCSESLIYKWKRENKLFQQARKQYETMIIEDKYVSEAMQSIYALVKSAKSEMVRLQAAISILKLAGRLTDNSIPELDKAKVRRANAEADIAEQKAQQLSNNVADDLTINIVRNDRSIENEEANNN
nr:phBC6A51 family helix-turn-helix protein [Ligilactobacillus salivarius]